MDTSIAEYLKLIVTALLIALFLNVAVIIYNVNQANTFEKQAVQIMQKDGGLTEDAIYQINNKKNGLRKQYWDMFDVQPDTKEKTVEETVERDTAAYFVPKTDDNDIATDVFEDIDHPNQLFKKDGNIDKSTIYVPEPTPHATIRYQLDKNDKPKLLDNSDYQHYLSLIKNEDYNEAMTFLHNYGIDPDVNTFYIVHTIKVPIYVAYNSTIDNQGNTGHKLTYKPVYIYGNQEVVKINGENTTPDGDEVKIKTPDGDEVTVKNDKGKEVPVNSVKESDLQPKNETYSVISTYNDKPIMINNNLLLTNTEIYPYGNKNKIHYWVNKEIHPYGTKIHYRVIIHIPFIAFSKANSGAAINHSYTGETVSQYGRQANQ